MVSPEGAPARSLCSGEKKIFSCERRWSFGVERESCLRKKERSERRRIERASRSDRINWRKARKESTREKPRKAPQQKQGRLGGDCT